MSVPKVIFVPGFGGNALIARSLPFAPEVWLSYPTLIAGLWRFLEIGSTVELTPGSALGQFYRLFIGALTDRGCSVVSARIDWRLPIAQNGGVLATQIHELTSEVGPIHLVAHSRGGLVCRKAVQLLGVQSPALVRSVTCIGTPHQGTLSAAALLGGWQQSKLALYALLSISERLLVGGFPRFELNRIISGWPSAYELLPSPGNGWLSPSDTAVVYSSASYAIHGLPVNPVMFASAQDAWDALPDMPITIPRLDIAGSGYSTPAGVENAEVLNRPWSMSREPVGDGVVHTGSAYQESSERWNVTASHEGLVRNRQVVQRVRRFIAEAS